MKYLAFTLLLVAASCPKEGDRQVNDQSEKAGGFIETKSTDPEVKQAGSDVRQNSETLRKNLLGAPEAPQPYSPKASADARKSSDQDHSGGFWLKLAGVLGGIATVLGVVLKFAPAILPGPAGIAVRLAAPALENVAEAITRARMKADENTDKKLHVDDLLKILSDMKDKMTPAQQEWLTDKVHQIEEKLGTRL